MFRGVSERRWPATLTFNSLYALLGLSVIESLFGVINTPVLSAFERTRELGMLRAIGMTRGSATSGRRSGP
jgi:ABC-type antimicrobial peptide transport system permease subunit